MTTCPDIVSPLVNVALGLSGSIKSSMVETEDVMREMGRAVKDFAMISL